PALPEEAPAPRERHPRVRPPPARQLHEPLAHAGVELDELRVPRSPVAEHRFLDRAGRGQRTGRQQPGIASGLAHVVLLSAPDLDAVGIVRWPEGAVRGRVGAADLDLEEGIGEVALVDAPGALHVTHGAGAAQAGAVGPGPGRAPST